MQRARPKTALSGGELTASQLLLIILAARVCKNRGELVRAHTHHTQTHEGVQRRGLL